MLNETISELRTTIKDLGLKWLDEEIEDIISTGKLQSKNIESEYRKKQLGIEQIPYSDYEILKIIIESLENYFIILPKVQSDLEDSFQKYLKLSEMSFLDEENRKIDKISKDTGLLSKLLNDLKYESNSNS